KWSESQKIIAIFLPGFGKFLDEYPKATHAHASRQHCPPDDRPEILVHSVVERPLPPRRSTDHGSKRRSFCHGAIPLGARPVPAKGSKAPAEYEPPGIHWLGVHR